MSEKMPEVGDVWEWNGHLMRMLRVGKKYNTEYVYALMKIRDEVLAVECYSVSYIKSVGEYLGKSKADIKQLFEIDDGREFTGLYDKFGKKIMFGDVVHWTDGGDELSLEERIKTRWDRIAVVRKLYGAEVNFKVIDSPSKKVIEYDMDFDFGSFIYQDTKKYLTVVAESEKEYFDKFKTAGECMKWVLDREEQDER